MNFAQSLGGLSIWILLWGASSLRAQMSRAYDWTEQNQSYLRIPIAQSGFYQVSRTTLQQAGIPVASTDARNYRLYRRGKEVSLEIIETNEATIASLGFYAEKNDGWFESNLYLKPEFMPHPYYSLYSDTAAYFLAWHPQPTPAQRIGTAGHIGSGLETDHHIHENLSLLTTDYPAGQFYPPEHGYSNGSVRTEYDLGEGWTGGVIDKGNPFSMTIMLERAVFIPDTKAHLKLLLVGRSGGKHQVTIQVLPSSGVPKTLGSPQWNGYETITFESVLEVDEFFSQKELKIEIKAISEQGALSLSYALLRYPQSSTFTSDQQQICHFDAGAKMWKVDSSPSRQFYDISDPVNPKKMIPDKGAIRVMGTQVLAMVEPLHISSAELVHFSARDLLSIDYLILTHRALRRPLDGRDVVEAYADYRRSAKGGNFRVLIMNIDEVTDRYHYGDRGPTGIRNLIASLPNIKYVFIIGKSIDPQAARKTAKAQSQDLVPNAGWPGSDIALVTNLNGSGEFIPLVPIGRLNTDKTSHIWDYLKKVSEMEAEPETAAWRKRILHLSGGISLAERSVFREYVDDFAKTLQASDLAPEISTISKKGEQAVEQFEINEPINRGVALVTLFGHTGLNRTDIDIGLASDLRRHYQNHPFYPALLVNGCAIGNIFFSQPTLTNDWILAKEKGAVLSIAHSHNGLTAQLKHYTDSFYAVLADSSFRTKGFGDIQVEAIRRNVQRYPFLLDGITSTQMTLQGDPAIRTFPATQPDYAWDVQDLRITASNLGQPNSFSDSLYLQIPILNHGPYQADSLTIDFTRHNAGLLVQQHKLRLAAPRLKEILKLTISNESGMGGDERWTLEIDPEDQIAESNKDNNKLSASWYLPLGGAQPIWPETNFNTDVFQLELVAQSPEALSEGYIIFEWSPDSSFAGSATQKRSILTSQQIASNVISLIPETTIYWRVWMQGSAHKPSSYRRIRQRTAINDPPILLPEAIALFTGPATNEYLEGVNFTVLAQFKNIAPVPFSDTIKIKQTWTVSGTSQETTFTIAPLKAKGQVDIEIPLSTTGKVGRNRLKIDFNSERTPEVSYHNNAWHYEFDVIADRIPPQIRVTVDHRAVKNKETIAPNALFEIRVIDNNRGYPPIDTSSVLIYLTRDCRGCYPQRMHLQAARWETQPSGDLKIEFRPAQSLAAGSYLLQVYAQDRSNNWSPAYEINLIVKDKLAIASYHIYPNPSGSWFYFEVNIEGHPPPPGWQVEVWDAKGSRIVMYQNSLIVGLNRWLWWPQGLSAGSYWYRIKIDNSYSALQNTLRHGRLVYNP